MKKLYIFKYREVEYKANASAAESSRVIVVKCADGTKKVEVLARVHKIPVGPRNYKKARK